jgi:hypothetical protein
MTVEDATDENDFRRIRFPMWNGTAVVIVTVSYLALTERGSREGLPVDSLKMGELFDCLREDVETVASEEYDLGHVDRSTATWVVNVPDDRLNPAA